MSRIDRPLARFRGDRRGIAAIEFAIIAPVLLVGSLGAVEVSNAVRANLRLGVAAQVMADLVAQQGNVAGASIANFCTGARLALIPLGTTSFSAAVVSVTNSGSGRSVDWQDTSCGSAISLSNATTLAVNLTPTVNDSVIIVKASYTYSFVSSVVTPASMTFTRTAYARPRGSGSVTHN